MLTHHPPEVVRRMQLIEVRAAWRAIQEARLQQAEVLLLALGARQAAG